VNFFEQQDIARKKTRYLVFLLCMAVSSLIAITTLFVAAFFYFSQKHDPAEPVVFSAILHSISIEIFAVISLTVIFVIFSGSLYKLFQVRKGGKSIAEALDARLISAETKIFAERKVLNVVEEMAIASGTPVPPVYVIEDPSVNAFAAGHSPRDAIIGITRGAIEMLSRDELQGVIAHEFSHVFHGDMKLNMRLIAILHGILLLGLIGQFLVRNSFYARSRSSKDNGKFAIMAFGLGLIIIGYAGTFFGNLIKAAVSRQREFLADASSVQYTRNPSGIGNALKKLGGRAEGSHLSNPAAAEFSHLYFAEGISHFLSLMATHPKLEERIKRIEPYWNGEFLYTSAADEEIPQEIHSSQNAQHSITPQQTLGVIAALSQIGQPSPEHLAYAQETLGNMDEYLRDATHHPSTAQAVIFGLLLSKIPEEQNLQWKLIANLFNAEELAEMESATRMAASADESLRLPLLELCLPTLKTLDKTAIDKFLKAVHQLIYADNRISGMEWAVNHILRHHLLEMAIGSASYQLSDLTPELSQLLSMLAHAGNQNIQACELAFSTAVRELELENIPLIERKKLNLTQVDSALEKFTQLKPLQKPKLLKALSQCVLADRQITQREAELLRAMAAAMDCPMPPIVATPAAV
jgi:Zn-dependent protease with chaperone function/uncharacterized tellurite resistance protein B-like protein